MDRFPHGSVHTRFPRGPGGPWRGSDVANDPRDGSGVTDDPGGGSGIGGGDKRWPRSLPQTAVIEALVLRGVRLVFPLLVLGLLLLRPNAGLLVLGLQLLGTRAGLLVLWGGSDVADDPRGGTGVTGDPGGGSGIGGGDKRWLRSVPQTAAIEAPVLRGVRIAPRGALHILPALTAVRGLGVPTGRAASRGPRRTS